MALITNLGMRFHMDPLRTAERACAIAQLLSTLESFSAEERKYGGINDWNLTSILDGSRFSIKDEAFREIFIRGNFIARAAASFALILPTSNGVRLGATGISALSQLLINKYTINGSDGAEQYSAIIFAACAMGRTDKGKNVDLAVDFIAAQTVLSYFVAGAVKWLGSEWRNGTAVERVIRTKVYGSRTFYQLLRRWPRVSETLTYQTVAVEALFPLLVISKYTRLPALTTMFLFHAANARLMGLGRFFIVFTSTYPAVLASFGSREEKTK